MTELWRMHGCYQYPPYYKIITPMSNKNKTIDVTILKC